MKEFFNEHGDSIFKALGLGVFLIILNRIAKIFKGPDGKFQIKEFLQMAAFIIFTSLAVYMVMKEANRDHEWHLFDGFWIGVVFFSLLSVLHMDHVVTKFSTIFENLVRLRMKVAPPPAIGEAEEPKKAAPQEAIVL